MSSNPTAMHEGLALGVSCSGQSFRERLVWRDTRSVSRRGDVAMVFALARWGRSGSRPGTIQYSSIKQCASGQPTTLDVCVRRWGCSIGTCEVCLEQRIQSVAPVILPWSRIRGGSIDRSRAVQGKLHSHRVNAFMPRKSCTNIHVGDVKSSRFS